MARFVRDAGRLDAEVLIIGEAPGAKENQRGTPFVGPSGKLLTRFMRHAGLLRSCARITNTYPYQPPYNDLGRIPLAKRQEHVKTLHELIARMKKRNLKLIIPMGNYALQAVIPEIPGTITKLRGSVYSYQGIHVLPMVHPAMTFREPMYIRHSMMDWERAAKILADPSCVAPPQRRLEIFPSMQRLRQIRDQVIALPETAIIGVDIETPRNKIKKKIGMFKNGKPRYKTEKGPRFIACLAIALSPTHAICIPLLKTYWKHHHIAAWNLVQEILESQCAKVFHNGMFDVFHLRRVRINVRNWIYDTKDMHHALDCWSRHSLAFCASTDTWEPYWKDEGKDGKDQGLPFDLARYYRYNAKDAAVTLELCLLYLERLAALPYENPQDAIAA